MQLNQLTERKARHGAARRSILALVLLLALFAGSAAAQGEAPAAAQAGNAGKVYVMTNDAAGNAIQVFDRAADGALTAAGIFPTGGLGSGSGLGSQGALILSDDNRLFAVNAGSNEISSFRVRGTELVWADTVSSEGEMPISLAYDGRRLYVVNAGGSGNIAGFKVQPNGEILPIPGATQPLSNGGVGAAPGPAQISFTPNGSQLIVAEKATNLLVTYNVTRDGVEPGVTHASAGMTPFGFGFARRNILIVSEAFGGAADASAVSSYRVGRGTLDNVTPSAPTEQTAACWVVVTGNGRYIYTTNTGSGSVSGYEIARDGSLTLLDADGRTGVTGDGSSPIDASLSRNSQYLYVLNAGAATISAFAVERDGSLTHLGDTPVAGGSVGIAAR
jgi:6-phosphogluconolactonase (cycloisomerase 2 family)